MSAQNNSLKTPLGRFLKIGFAEGISFIVLLGIAMPLKYIAGIPAPVRIVGMLHGIFFIGYTISLSQAARAYKWPFKKVLTAFLLSFLPFGTFFLEKILDKQN